MQAVDALLEQIVRAELAPIAFTAFSPMRWPERGEAAENRAASPPVAELEMKFARMKLRPRPDLSERNLAL